MSLDQAYACGIIVVGLGLFAWGRWRHDGVAVMLLVAAVACGIVPAERAFSGFGDAAVVTVIAVLIMSRAVERARVIDALTEAFGSVPRSQPLQIGALMLCVAVLSAFMMST